MIHPAWVEVDLSQFRQNLRAIRKRSLAARLCVMVKANAYGHGLTQMGLTAQGAGADYLGVSCLQEGVLLREAGVALPVLVFGAIHADQVEDLLHWDLEISISSKFKAELVAAACHRLQKTCRVHLEVDTGMQRTGVRPETALELISWLQKQSLLQVAGIYSHFATADTPGNSFALEQIARFSRLPHVGMIHMANSGGLLYYPEAHFDMVRPGLLCYGYFPDGNVDPKGEIAPCLSLKAKVSYFKVVGAGEGISYGHRYRTARQTRIVTVPIGYGDGYRRSLSPGSVLIRGKKYPIAGTICMDQLMVDVGEEEVHVGDEVTLIGGAIRLTELAEAAQTIPYELLTALGSRLPRIYSTNPVVK